MNDAVESPRRPASLALKAMGVFLLFGATMAWLAGMTLVWRGTPLDRIWELNPRAYADLAPFGPLAGVAFLLLAAALFAAGLGWFRRCLWGWGLATGIIGAQVLGNVAHLAFGRVAEGAVGLVISGFLLVFLLRKNVRSFFGAVGGAGGRKE